MTDLVICALLIMLLLRVISEGEPIELDDLLAPPALLALAAFLGLAVLTGLRARAYHLAGGQHFPALGMLGLGACGVLLILFPSRMPDVVRGGTPMTAFWGLFGWLLLALAGGVVLALAPP